MPTLIIPGAYQVSINAESGGQTVTNVIGVSGISGQATNIANAVLTALKISNGPLARHSTLYSLTSIRCVDLSSATGQVVEIAATGTGLSSGALATNASCAVVSLKGGTRSRSASGRLYHGPLTETAIQANGRTLEPTSATTIQGAYALFQGSLVSAGFDWVVLSRKLSIFTPVRNIGIDSIIGTQRRRIRGR